MYNRAAPIDYTWRFTITISATNDVHLSVGGRIAALAFAAPVTRPVAA